MSRLGLDQTVTLTANKLLYLHNRWRPRRSYYFETLFRPSLAVRRFSGHHSDTALTNRVSDSSLELEVSLNYVETEKKEAVAHRPLTTGTCLFGMQKSCHFHLQKLEVSIQRPGWTSTRQPLLGYEHSIFLTQWRRLEKSHAPLESPCLKSFLPVLPGLMALLFRLIVFLSLRGKLALCLPCYVVSWLLKPAYPRSMQLHSCSFTLSSLVKL